MFSFDNLPAIYTVIVISKHVSFYRVYPAYLQLQNASV